MPEKLSKYEIWSTGYVQKSKMRFFYQKKFKNQIIKHKKKLVKIYLSMKSEPKPLKTNSQKKKNSQKKAKKKKNGRNFFKV